MRTISRVDKPIKREDIFKSKLSITLTDRCYDTIWVDAFVIPPLIVSQLPIPMLNWSMYLPF